MSSAGAIRAGRAFIEIFAEDSKLARGLRQAQAKLRAFSLSVQQLGQKMFFGGVTAALPFGLSLATFALFERSMSRVRALTQASNVDFDRLRTKAKELGAATVFSAGQAADAMGNFALAGFSVDEILASVGPTLDLAAAGQLEIAEAASISAAILRGMGIEAGQLGNVVDVLALAMSTSNTDVRGLGEAMKFVAPIARSAGVSLEEIVAAIQVLSDAGQAGEMAGTTLRGAILALTAPSSEAEAELDRLGVKVADEKGNFRGLAAIVGDLQDALSGMGNAQKLKTLGTIFPNRQAAGFATLVAEGSDRLLELTAALRKAGGTGARIASQQLDNLAGDAVILTSALEGLAIGVGEGLNGILRQLTQWASRATVSLTGWIERNPGLVAAIAATVVGVTVLGAGLVALSLVVRVAAFALSGLSMAAALVRLGFSAVATLLPLLLSPWGILLTGAMALGAAWLLLSQDGQRATASLKSAFSQMASDAVTSLNAIQAALANGDFAAASNILWLSLKQIWLQGVTALTGVWTEWKTSFQQTAIDAFFGVLEIANSVWASLRTGIVGVTAFLRTSFAEAVGFVAERLIDLQEAVGSLSPEIAEDARQTIRGETRQRTGDIAAEAQREKERIESERARKEEELADANLDANDEMARRNDEALKGVTEELERARRAWKKAVDDANQVVAEAEIPDDARARDAGKRMKGALEQAEKVGAKAVGTFSGAALGGLGSSGPAERTAKAAEETAKNTDELVSIAREGGLAFT